MSKVKLTITYFIKDEKSGHYKDICVDGFVDDAFTTQRTFDNTAELTKFVDDVTKYYNDSVVELTNFSVNPFKMLANPNKKHTTERKDNNYYRITRELQELKGEIAELKDIQQTTIRSISKLNNATVVNNSHNDSANISAEKLNIIEYC